MNLKIIPKLVAVHGEYLVLAKKGNELDLPPILLSPPQDLQHLPQFDMDELYTRKR